MNTWPLILPVKSQMTIMLSETVTAGTIVAGLQTEMTTMKPKAVFQSWWNHEIRQDSEILLKIVYVLKEDR